ncbi:MAG: hypothetical protein ABIJ57_07020, partial [Pseudomonadota bacterium]
RGNEAGIRNIRIAPTGKQVLFHQAVAKYEEVGFGGARGPGKTFALDHEGFRQSILYPGNVGVIARRDLVDLRKTTLDVFLRYIAPKYKAAGIKIVQRMSPQIETDIHVNGQISKIIWCETKDVASLMSANLGWLALDEASEIPYDFYLMTSAAVGRCILPNGFMPPGKIFWASNPGPGWLGERFPVGPEPARIQTEIVDRDGNKRMINRAFIPALPKDNPHLPPDFEARLRESYPGDWVRRYLEGDWTAFEGQIFTEFDPKVHVSRLPFTMRPLPITHLLSMDWGYVNPSAALMVSIDLDGHIYVWQEYRQAGYSPDEHLPRLKRMVEGMRITAHLMDPAAVDQSSGISLREQFTNLGMPFMGWRKRKHGPDGTIYFLKTLLKNRRITISPDCHFLIKEIIAARWQEQTATQALKEDPRELMVDKDDHSVDALFGALEWYRSVPGEIKPRAKGLMSEMAFARELYMQREPDLRRRDVCTGKDVVKKHKLRGM